MKITKRIRNKQNYYIEMDPNDEIHITNKKGDIVASLTMKDKGMIKAWGSCSQIVNKDLQEQQHKYIEPTIKRGIIP